jgi:hypothetical protein
VFGKESPTRISIYKWYKLLITPASFIKEKSEEDGKLLKLWWVKLGRTSSTFEI